MSTTEQLAKPQTAVSQLDQLKKFTKVVADTGDFDTIKEYAPQDATTNPSLILKAAQLPAYKRLLDKAIAEGKKSKATGEELLSVIVDDLLVAFGTEILKIVPGRVSTETDAVLSFDTQGLIDKAHKFIELYKQNGIGRERILIKIASTWEGIRAAEVLQKEGINCNMTLLFSLAQAVACAEAKAKLISPFVGRILDWYKAKTGKDFAPAEDPGVKSVREIYAYYKKYGYATEVMGASFRNVGRNPGTGGVRFADDQPVAAGGIKKEHGAGDAQAGSGGGEEQQYRSGWNWTKRSSAILFNDDAMATEKTAEGIRTFRRRHGEAAEVSCGEALSRRAASNLFKGGKKYQSALERDYAGATPGDCE